MLIDKRIPATAATPSSPVESVSADVSAPRLDGYEVVRILGEGGQGRVWLVTRTRDGYRAAIKVLRSLDRKNEQALARFEQSIATLSALDHPGIVRSIEYGELPTGERWHATDYIPGRTLLEHIDQLDVQFRHERGRESRLPVQSVIELFIQICDAVEAAHRVGVIHRDLKPSNIIVDDEGRPHLLDFGHATAPEGADMANLTISGEFLGTPAYASPEQVLCRPGTIDVRTDVYAIGVMLYQCLTGTFPYNVNASLASTFEQIQYADPTPPRVHVPWIDRDLQAIILRALAKQREQRYQSVSDMREDLERYLRGEAVTARGSGTAYLLLKFLRKHRVLTATVSVGGLLTILYAASMTALYRRAANAEDAALRHAAEAREKFSIARETLDFVVSQIETRLDRVAGTRDLRRELLQDAYNKLADLTTSDSDNPALRAELAAVHRKLGNIAKDLYLADDAARHRETSLQILQELVAQHPHNTDYLESLSIAYVLVGDVEKSRLNWPEVIRRYQQALAIDEELVAEHPENDRYLDNLAWSYERMAGWP